HTIPRDANKNPEPGHRRAGLGGKGGHGRWLPGYGGEVGRISSYSDLSSAWPSLAGTRSKSSSISPLVNVLRNFVRNCPSLTCPARILSCLTSSAGASRTR